MEQTSVKFQAFLIPKKKEKKKGGKKKQHSSRRLKLQTEQEAYNLSGLEAKQK